MTTTTGVSLYLSRLLLDLDCRQVAAELAHPYEMHRTLMHAFERCRVEAGENAREKFSVLFRADVDEERDRVTVYVQSSVEPDWSFLAGKPGYLLSDGESPNPAGKAVAVAYSKLRIGQVLSFRLRANPTKRIGKPAKGDADLKGKRVGLLREEEQIAWLVRKGQEREKEQPGGFEIVMKDVRGRDGTVCRVPCVRACLEGKQTGRKRVDNKSLETTHLAVRFDGLLRITDAEAFRQTLVRGIGGAKAYGFGLLSIAPASRGNDLI